MLLVISEIKQTVDLAGLMEQLKLITIDSVSRLMVNLQVYYQLLIQLHAVDSSNANQWAAMEDKSVLLGPGSKALVL